METLKTGNYRIVHLTDGELIPSAINAINNGEADGINFNFIKNFPKNIEAIKLAKGLKQVVINDYSWDFDYSAIHHIDTLESISIYTDDKKEIDFLKFQYLKETAIFWRPKASSLFECVDIESLFLGKYNEPDLQNLKRLKKLKYLRINTGSVKALTGIDQLENLETLILMQATRLEDLNGIDLLKKLRRLRIDNCKNVKGIELLLKMDWLTSLEILGTTPKP